MKVKFTVPGEPQGKGRARTVRLKNGKAHTYTPDATAVYENLIIVEYQRQAGGRKFPDGEMIDLRIIAYYAIPASSPKKKKALMEGGGMRPTKLPDWDNIGKVVSDALNGIAYRDDKQVVDAQVRKFYSDTPRLEITVQSAG
jgi:Holliday junction resolvase RusA-like endonuclease